MPCPGRDGPRPRLTDADDAGRRRFPGAVDAAALQFRRRRLEGEGDLVVAAEEYGSAVETPDCLPGLFR